MSKEYNLPKSMIREANEEAIKEGFHPDSVHHIVPKSVAKRYNLPHEKIVSLDNAIALDQPFHNWIHEVFEEDDYVYLAQALLGIPAEDFEKRKRITEEFHQRRKQKKRGKRRR